MVIMIAKEITNAIKEGNLDLIKFAHQNGVEVTDDSADHEYIEILEESAKHGHVHIIKWALSTFPLFEEFRIDYNIGYGAGLGGRLQAVEFAMSRNSEYCREYICKGAAVGGHLDILKGINQLNWDRFSIKDIIKTDNGRNLEVLEWCMKQNPSIAPPKCLLISDVLWNGFNIDFLDRIHSMGLLEDDGDRTCNIFAERGDLSHVKWARRNGFTWCSGVSAFAAVYGKVDMLMYVIENGCPWNEDVFEQIFYSFEEDEKSSEIPTALKWARTYGKQ